MANQLVIRPRRTKPKRTLSFAVAGSFPGAAGAAFDAPRLALAAPEDGRSRLLTGGVTALAHAALLAALLVAAALAPPELIEKVIPVALVPVAPLELPGSNAEPAPAGPRAVGVRRANAAELAASQILSPAQAAAMRDEALAANRRAIADLALENAPELARPKPIERRDVAPETSAARDVTAAQPVAVAPARDLARRPLDAAALAVPAPDRTAPRAIDPGSLSPSAAPEARAVLDSLGDLGHLDDADYSGSVDAGALASGDRAARSTVAVGIDTGLAGGAAGGGSASGLGGADARGSGLGGDGTDGVPGGTGDAQGVARCLESAPVQRYLDVVQQRTRDRWTVPEGVPDDAEVVLRFSLDAAGMANQIEGRESDEANLSASARQALQRASPFPPMIDANRCLTDKRIRLTFTVPTR